MWKVIGPILVFIALVVFVILFLPDNTITFNGNMVLNSSAFENSGTIPVAYTCDGQNTNPPLLISGVPSNAKSLVLLVYDQDSPDAEFSHWVVFNIKPSITEIPSGFDEGKTGFNSAKEKTYTGPCPPMGDEAHTYVFELYAVNTVPVFSPTRPITREVVEEKIKGRVVEKTTFTGTYSR